MMPRLDLPAPDRPSHFPCARCGAVMHFAIGSGSLRCTHCGERQAIAPGTDDIRELDLSSALARVAAAAPARPASPSVQCPNCAAAFTLPSTEHAGACPYCDTPVVLDARHDPGPTPQAVLPFAIDSDTARRAWQRWLDGLWFAPSALARDARESERLRGVYVPYWTYDSQTETDYAGERGDVYYVTERYRAVENGRHVQRTRQVPRIRWTRVQGHTARHFDDVLVGATDTLPRQITDWLAPWDLDALVPYDAAWLAGFGSEIRQIGLDVGLQHARAIMDRTIRDDVRRAIGGDRQRIHRLGTVHRETSYKLVLLPLWIAAFRHGERRYRFVVNGRTGRVRGERPYSRAKIAAAVVIGVVAAAALLLLAESTGTLDLVMSDMMRQF